MFRSILRSFSIDILLIGFFFILDQIDQTKIQAITQDFSTRRLRQSHHDVRYTTRMPFNASFSTAVIHQKQKDMNSSLVANTQNLLRDNNMILRDATPTNYSKSLQTSARAMQDGGERYDSRIPFWNIAHMINSIEEIEPALNEGANGIEVDISFDKRGIPTETYHGFPCDCGRHCHQHEQFIKFLEHIGQMSSQPSSSRLQLILFDLKLKELGYLQKELAGNYMAANINEHIYRRYLQSTPQHGGFSVQPPIRIIISINHVDDIVLVRSFIDYMRKNQLDFMSQQMGFDVGMNDDLGEISAMWNSLNGITFNIWQGDGLTNCANIIRGSERLKAAISIRNQQGHFRKIYYWTADVLYHIRSVLNLGLDAILTNQPQRVLQALEEPEYKTRYRLASPYDDPFAQFWIQSIAWKMPVPTLSEVVETVSNIQKTSANFVRTLPDGIAAAIKKVHESIGGTE